jgi:hypothetical protein
MMPSQAEAENHRDAIVHAASEAYFAASSSVLYLAQLGGADIRERPVWPGAISTMRYAEPLAGIRAAQTVRSAADRVTDDYVRHARAEGTAWCHIGEALELAENSQLTSHDLAIAAYEQLTGARDLPAFQTPVFHYTCQACQQPISDRGPYESHPLDNEHGHTEDCPRPTEQVAAWQAKRDAEDAQWQARQAPQPGETGAGPKPEVA